MQDEVIISPDTPPPNRIPPGQFAALPRIKVHAGFHRVIRWFRLPNLWEGVATRHLVNLAAGVKFDCTHVLAHRFDGPWTTNLLLADFLSEEALVAFTHYGEPLTLKHAAPARLIFPQLYAWKSAKWLRALEFLAAGRAGLCERNGYHRHGDPWPEELFGW